MHKVGPKDRFAAPLLSLYLSTAIVFCLDIGSRRCQHVMEIRVRKLFFRKSAAQCGSHDRSHSQLTMGFCCAMSIYGRQPSCMDVTHLPKEGLYTVYTWQVAWMSHTSGGIPLPTNWLKRPKGTHGRWTNSTFHTAFCFVSPFLLATLLHTSFMVF